MRSSLLLTGTLVFTLAGCGGDAFSAHSDIAAEAAGQELPAERVAEILTQVKTVPINVDAADFVASLWVDYTVFAQAIAEGSLEADSAMIAKAMWVRTTEFSLTHYLEQIVEERGAITPEIVDSTYNADGVRVLQHVLVTVDPSAPEAERVGARREIDRILGQATDGDNFGALALEHSGDPSAQADSGYLPPSPRGAFVAPFDSAAWLLSPGEISGVVVTTYGFHIIRRPGIDEAGSRLDSWLGPVVANNIQQDFFASLDSINEIKVSGSGLGKAREVFANLDRARGRTGKIATYKGGALTEGDLAFFTRSASADPETGPDLLKNLIAAPDSMLESALKGVAMQYVFVRDAEAAGAKPTAEEWQAISDDFNASVDSLRAAIGLGDDVIDPSAPEADRRRAAALRVETFFDEMLTGQSRLRVMPGMLAWSLRGNSDAFVNPAGVRQAVALAEAVRTADSTSAVGLAPAAGGPPIPGVAPSPIQPATGGPPVQEGQ